MSWIDSNVLKRIGFKSLSQNLGKENHFDTVYSHKRIFWESIIVTLAVRLVKLKHKLTLDFQKIDASLQIPIINNILKVQETQGTFKFTILSLK